MKRILIFANTYYQLIMAIQLKYTLFRDDYVALVLSDHSNGAEKVYDRLKKQNFFDETAFVKSKGVIHNRKASEKITETFHLIFRNSNNYSFYLDGLSSLVFDQVLFYNIEIDTYGVFSILAAHNKKIEFSSYEEGILSYDNFFYDSTKFKFIRTCRHLINKPAIFDHYKTFYCVYPELYTGNAQPVSIPQISSDNNEMKSLLADIFNIDTSVNYEKYRYIYFESSYESNNQPIGEMEVFQQLVEIVGAENILVKKHPRSVTRYFEEHGIQVDTNSNAPFEAIQLNCEMSSCTFICAASGSVLSVNSVIDKPSKTLLFYPMTDYHKYDPIRKYIEHVDQVVNKLHSAGKLKHVKAVRDLSEIKE